MASGINLKAATTAYKSVSSDIITLESKLEEYSKTVTLMYQLVWNGGTSANRWYSAASSAYNADRKFVNKLRSVQKSLFKQIRKAYAASGQEMPSGLYSTEEYVVNDVKYN